VLRQDRVHLRRYADLVAPILHGALTNQALRAAALTDQLTGLANRRALDRELDRLCEAGRSVSLLLLDVDGLKEVNDSLGYEQGDHLITALAAALRETVGRDHVVARMGGDEFVVILPDSSQKEVKKRARKVRRALERQPLPPAVAAVSRGVSVGVVEGRPGETPRQLVRRAARSMRSQKRRRASDRG
jgi:diguanylate cyclase (GGDEF)-like protein